LAMSLVENEQTKLLAAALNTAGTSAFAIGVLAPVAAAFYSVGQGRVSFTTILIGVVIWVSAAFVLHLGARQVLRRLRP
jgi:ACR3 family arsenite efflux pump ArsB